MRVAWALGLLGACAIPAPHPPEASRTFIIEGYDIPACSACVAKLGEGERSLGCNAVTIEGALWDRAPLYAATVCFVGAAR